MFTKLFGNRKEKFGRGRSEAIVTLQLLDYAVRSIHPDKYISDMDAAMELQPLRVSVNVMLGRHETERFFPIEYQAVVDRISFYARKNLLGEVERLSREIPVVNALIHGALHEVRIVVNKQQHDSVNLGAEVQSTTKTLVDFLNIGAKRRLEPMPGD